MRGSSISRRRTRKAKEILPDVLSDARLGRLPLLLLLLRAVLSGVAGGPAGRTAQRYVAGRYRTGKATGSLLVAPLRPFKACDATQCIDVL